MEKENTGSNKLNRNFKNVILLALVLFIQMVMLLTMFHLRADPGMECSGLRIKAT
jgi:hypothetical protein